MIKDEYTGYIIAVVKLKDIEELKRLPGDLKIILDYRDIPSKEYLLAALHNFLETNYLKDNWIRDDVYRFLAFIYRETQIDKIIDRVKNIIDPVAIIIVKDGKDKPLDIDKEMIINLKSSFEGIDELAIFRLYLEKERGRF
ncbi:MAG TPA: hypothetical protein EYH44_01775 [Thermoprotei archaeon]|nr:hypothetical protein [Thermoprotei archaeon]